MVHVMCFIASEVKINQFITLKIQLRIRLFAGGPVLFGLERFGLFAPQPEGEIYWESNFEIKLELVNFQYLMKIS